MAIFLATVAVVMNVNNDFFSSMLGKFKYGKNYDDKGPVVRKPINLIQD